MGLKDMSSPLPQKATLSTCMSDVDSKWCMMPKIWGFGQMRNALPVAVMLLKTMPRKIGARHHRIKMRLCSAFPWKPCDTSGHSSIMIPLIAQSHSKCFLYVLLLSLHCDTKR